MSSRLWGDEISGLPLKNAYRKLKPLGNWNANVYSSSLLLGPDIFRCSWHLHNPLSAMIVNTNRISHHLYRDNSLYTLVKVMLDLVDAKDLSWMHAALFHEVGFWSEAMGKVRWAPICVYFCLLIADAVWPAASCLCHHVFPSEEDTEHTVSPHTTIQNRSNLEVLLEGYLVTAVRETADTISAWEPDIWIGFPCVPEAPQGHITHKRDEHRSLKVLPFYS